MPKLHKKSVGRRSRNCCDDDHEEIRYKHGYRKCCKPHPCVIERGTPICYPACPPECPTEPEYPVHTHPAMLPFMTSNAGVTSGDFIGQGQDGTFNAVALVSPHECKFTKIVAHVKGATLTTGDSGVFTLYINGIVQPLVVQVDPSSPSNAGGKYNVAENLTGVPVTVGDLIAIQFTRNGSNWTVPGGLAVSLVCEN
ncbi:hypothetical protein QKU48_gp0044 [Fadolivirus algeromassiliense]|jgi:hypothetical protein|uniref:Uncharacterized protein n=1 Tax=Fadolivirus FV1/VV64 TaxID=3070911 RepID=A0A7D3R079_9VIRU|nr:hypothetical protein QKU48_gp0044 [Fadolivirus algeromassiliense]QKF93502.1 hypothetical protein Fadolivirus_1_44 [Fadolivirus FV1/VV64]